MLSWERDLLGRLQRTTEESQPNKDVDPHFSHAPSLDRRDSLLLVKNYFWKSWSRNLFYFYFKRKIKQERKP